ncbi:hypothetical protein G6L37_00075 [Agrobacterium rubi]|nr:hypothetical protein [Agrobacterium rubi]NTF23646.1 hypothetical protein [Agrobacterium rubi]
MEFFKKRSDDFFRGLGAEFVFKTTDGISLVSGGRVLKVRLEGPEGEKDTSRVVLLEPDNARHVVFEGDALSAARKLVEIGSAATTPRTRVNVSRRGLYLGLAAFTALYVIFCHPSTRNAGDTTASELSSLLRDIPALARGGAPGISLPAGISPPVPAEVKASITGSSVLDKPEFLSLPEDAPHEEAAAADKDSTEVAAVIPSYSADLYKPDVKTINEKATVTAAAAPSPTVEKNEVPKVVAADRPEAAVSADATAASSADVGVKQVGEPLKVAAATPSAGSTGAIAPGASAASPEEAKAIATNATKNMDANDTAALLKQIEQMMQMDPTAITPDMLSKLPHDIAQALRDTGVLDNPGAIPEKGNAPYAAIRLPEGVIDNFRGKDGIASIPENDTYAALGNRISLQLPGGGDIRKPEDLMLFGFKP